MIGLIKKTFLFFLMLCNALLHGATLNNPEQSQTTNNYSEDLEILLQNYVKNTSAVGIVVGLIENGKTSYFSQGLENINEPNQISEHSIFEIGSISKVFTTLLLMDQVDKGNMQLDDPIEQYLPCEVPEKNGKKITLYHLATHTSGLPRLPKNLSFWNMDFSNPYKDYDKEDLYDFLNSYQLPRSPGQTYEYSNVGMGLLGHILTLYTGKTYEQQIKEVICSKLKMQETQISLDPYKMDHITCGHSGKKPAPNWDLSVLEGAGGIRSNVLDMVSFLRANIDKKDGRLSDLLKKCHKEKFEIELNFSIGLGWHISDSIVWHNGGTGGFRSFIGFDSKTRKGVVIFTNSTEDIPDKLGFNLLDPIKHPIVEETYYSSFIKSYKKCKEICKFILFN